MVVPGRDGQVAEAEHKGSLGTARVAAFFVAKYSQARPGAAQCGLECGPAWPGVCAALCRPVGPLWPLCGYRAATVAMPACGPDRREGRMRSAISWRSER